MRVAIVTQYYPPEPVPIPHALAHELTARGHSVRVITAFPSYPTGRVAEGFRQKWCHVEDDGGVRVKRVPTLVSHSRNPVTRMLGYLSFAASSLSGTRFVSDADIVYVYATQMTASIGPLFWWRFRKTPFLLHIQDLWPESITSSTMVTGRTGRAIGAVLNPLLRVVYRNASVIVAIAPKMAELLRDRGAPAERLHTVFNWADEYSQRRSTTEISRKGAGLRVLYAGNLGELQDLETVIIAAHLVEDLENFQLDIVGSGVAENRLRELVRSRGVRNVQFHGRVRADRMDQYFAQADFQMVSLKDLAIFAGTIPSKFQSSISLHMPVISTVPGDLSALIDEHGIGFTAKAESPEALARAFREAYALPQTSRDEMVTRAGSFYWDKMSRTHGVDVIERLMSEVVTNRIGSTR